MAPSMHACQQFRILISAKFCIVIRSLRHLVQEYMEVDLAEAVAALALAGNLLRFRPGGGGAGEEDLKHI